MNRRDLFKGITSIAGASVAALAARKGIGLPEAQPGAVIDKDGHLAVSNAYGVDVSGTVHASGTISFAEAHNNAIAFGGPLTSHNHSIPLNVAPGIHDGPIEVNVGRAWGVDVQPISGPLGKGQTSLSGIRLSDADYHGTPKD